MQNFSTQKIVEGAILSALFFILSLSSLYLPLVGIFLSFLSPLPILILTIRQGVKISIAAIVIGSLLVGIFSNLFQGIFVFLQFGILGVVLGYTIYKDFDIYKIFVIGVVSSLISQGLVIIFGMWITGVNPILLNISSMEKSLSNAFNLYSKMGIPKENIKQVQETFGSALKFIKIALPSIFLLSSIFNVFLNYAVSSVILKRLNIDIPKLPKFRDLRGNITFALGFLGGMLIFVFFPNSPIITKIGINLQLFFTIILFILGLSFVSFLFHKFNVPVYWRVIIYFFLIFQPVFTQIIMWTGFLDIFFDFRIIMEKKYNNKGR